jgi:hypothetical protein
MDSINYFGQNQLCKSVSFRYRWHGRNENCKIGSFSSPRLSALLSAYNSKRKDE